MRWRWRGYQRNGSLSPPPSIPTSGLLSLNKASKQSPECKPCSAFSWDPVMAGSTRCSKKHISVIVTWFLFSLFHYFTWFIMGVFPGEIRWQEGGACFSRHHMMDHAIFKNRSRGRSDSLERALRLQYSWIMLILNLVLCLLFEVKISYSTAIWYLLLSIKDSLLID